MDRNLLSGYPTIKPARSHECLSVLLYIIAFVISKNLLETLLSDFSVRRLGQS